MDYLKFLNVRKKQLQNVKSANSTDLQITENINDLKSRPTNAGPSCQTHRLSNINKKISRPFTKHVTSYLRDTSDLGTYATFRQIVSGDLP